MSRKKSKTTADLVDPKTGRKPSKEHPFQIEMSTEVKMMVESMPPDEQREMMELFHKIATGEIKGELMTEKDYKELEKQGIDLSKATFPKDKPEA
jgi:hypothetical protein